MALRDDIWRAINDAGVNVANDVDGRLDDLRNWIQSIIDWINRFYQERYDDFRDAAAGAPWPLSAIVDWFVNIVWGQVGYWVFWAVKQPFEWGRDVLNWLWVSDWGRFAPGVWILRLTYAIRDAAVAVLDGTAESIAWVQASIVAWASDRIGALWTYAEALLAQMQSTAAIIYQYIADQVGAAIQSAENYAGQLIRDLQAAVNDLDNRLSAEVSNLQRWASDELDGLRVQLDNAGQAISQVRRDLDEIRTDPAGWVLGNIASRFVDWAEQRILERW